MKLSVLVPLGLGLADLAWSLKALAPPPAANETATVGMINTVVYIFLHLPAVLLGSLPFGNSPAAGQALSNPERALIGILGAAQMAALSWWLARRFEKKDKFK